MGDEINRHSACSAPQLAMRCDDARYDITCTSCGEHCPAVKHRMSLTCTRDDGFVWVFTCSECGHDSAIAAGKLERLVLSGVAR